MTDRNEYLRNWRKAHKEQVKTYKRLYSRKHPEQRQNHKMKIRMKWIEFLGSKCSKCGYHKILQILEFHHFEPLRNANHSGSKRRRKYFESPYSKQFEITKVILLCPTCHAEEDYKLLREQKIILHENQKRVY